MGGQNFVLLVVQRELREIDSKAKKGRGKEKRAEVFMFKLIAIVILTVFCFFLGYFASNRYLLDENKGVCVKLR